MDTSATTRLFPALIHHIEGIIAAIATVGGGWVILRQFLYTDRIFFYIRMRVDLGEYNVLWHRPTSARHYTTIKWGRSAVSIRGLREGGVYLRHYARFLLFWLAIMRLINGYSGQCQSGAMAEAVVGGFC